MKLRLYHHPDGARIAYREAGTGPPLALLHSTGLTHREWEPVVDELAHRYRVVLPDLPLHGASEDRPTHAYSPDWLTEVLAAFLQDTCGPRPLIGGHGLGAQLALMATASHAIQPAKLVLLPNPMHTKPKRCGLERAGRVVVRAAVVPGVDRVIARSATLVLRPSRGDKLTVTGSPGARDVMRHALMDLGGNGNRVRSWAKAARRWPRGAQKDLIDAYPGFTFPVLLLWADEDAFHPLTIAEEALDLLPDAQLRVLKRTGFLVAYDDPVGLAREILAFCG
ncbi:alpha/beta hydrolase [Solirubrobacter ginsenosidimutans]|uniref:Alpha/beta hydrolase n=1 Tax=Solirubrobacter ginsenosidimutans TaxID=490573 RepID=A0A9X3MZT9_9ACTN|nr:alpha/beta hydrolase [Solirubrobacter ginsenosidimutans]MDA0165552.1 alpha/beta hydrolase [Solirubrobacter ginsenosidimutans]